MTRTESNPDRVRMQLLLAMTGFISVASTRICDAMLPALAQAFSITTIDAAATISAYAIAYGVMQLVYGPLGDRYGKPRVIALATASCAISTTCAALAPSLATLIMARAAMGAGTAAIVPLSLAWFGDNIPVTQRQQALARFSGLTVFGLLAGPLMGGFLAQALSWRAPFAVLASLFCCLALALWPRSRETGASTNEESGAALPYLPSLTGLLAKPWACIVLAVTCAESALAIGSLAFVPTVLHTRLGLTLAESGAVVSLFGLGGFLFSRSVAPMLRRVAPPTMPGIAGLVLALAFGLIATMSHWAWVAVGCTLAGFGFFLLHNTLQLQATQLDPKATGLAMSLFSCSLFIGQSACVALGAVIFLRAPSWSFGIAGVGLLGLGILLMHLLRGRSASATRG